MTKLNLTLLAAVATCVLGSTATLAQNAYIANNGSQNVSVINTATNQVTSTIQVGGSPTSVAVSPDGRKVYIANWFYAVNVIDTANNAVTSIPNNGNAVGIAVRPDGRRAYAANFYDQSVSVIDTGTNTVITTVPAGPTPNAVAVANNKVYVANWTSPATVTVIAAESNTLITTIPVDTGTSDPQLAASPDGRRVYVTNQIGSNVPVIDTATDTVIATISVDISVSAAVSRDGSKVYIANRSNHTWVVDTQTNIVIGGSDFINGGQAGVSVTPDGSKVYVANYDANTVTAFDPATGAISAIIPVGSYPLSFGNFIQPAPTFAGTPGKANCYGMSVSALTQQYGGLNNAAAALGYPSVSALQIAIDDYCEA
jgi:YVTN family beta-propeller protein